MRSRPKTKTRNAKKRVASVHGDVVEGYRTVAIGTQPEHLHPPYVSSIKRCPTRPLVRIPYTLSEVTGPSFDPKLVSSADCDLTRQLLPKTLVYALSLVVISSGVIVAAGTGEWHRLVVATLGALAACALFFAVNLMNPRWMAFGDVRLSLVFGFGLAWVSPMAVVQAFLYANILALVVGVTLIALHRADRRSALPFGLYMALGAGLVLVLWS